MSILIKLPHIIEEGKKQCEAILKTSSAPFHLVEGFQEEDQQDGNQGVIVNGDNLQFMASLLAQGEKLDLIYIDPPFFSKSNYGNAIKVKAKDSEKAQVITQNAYRDTWDGGLEGYLSMLTPRLYLMKALLKDTGTLWVHLDWHASHYVKILLDEIFGEEQFINEVIWNYKSGGASKKRFGRKHDTLLFYGKSKHYYFKPQQEKSYNRGMKPYRFKGVEEFQDPLGWYTMVNMKDVWQIDMVGRTSAERTGYATQKPESLIERILTSCTKEGDVCADFFAGSGTMAAVAQKMNRNWIACDIGGLSTLKTMQRIVKNRGNCQLLREKTDCGGVLDVRIEVVGQGHVGREMDVKVTLCSYRIKNMESLALDEKDRIQTQAVLETDSLQLIEYWSVDFQYDGICFKPQQRFAKEKGELLLYGTQAGSCFKKIAIGGMDSFGNSFFTVVTTKE
ncbi:MAG: site-specific DNA-methyltransferase [Anaerovorax sp.]